MVTGVIVRPVNNNCVSGECFPRALAPQVVVVAFGQARARAHYPLVGIVSLIASAAAAPVKLLGRHGAPASEKRLGGALLPQHA